MGRFRIFLTLIATLWGLAACQPAFEVYDLRCEGLTEPLAIDNPAPHFSWKIRSERPMEQAAYEIEVGPHLWRSGKVASADQVMIPYGGKPLSERQQAWWRVRVWDASGKASSWSPRQRFGIGVLSGLKGDFIGCCPGEGRQPVFRKTFRSEKAGKALLHVTSLGYHEVWLNGKKAVDDVLLPPVSQLDKRSLIVTYELPLQKGENEILLYAGSGWYRPATFGVAYDGPLVKAELDVEGEPILWTDGSWEGSKTGRRDLGTWRPHQFGGEWIPAENEPEWEPVEVATVDGIVESPMMCRPILVQEMLTPVAFEKQADGSFLVDFGRIVNAMIDITLAPDTAEQQVTATFSDFLHPDGTLEAATMSRDVYVTSGGGGHFFNRFNHHLMRYMRLEGISAPPAELRAYRIDDDVSWESRFECSDPDLNAIYGLVEASLRNLTFGGYLVDCASIERLGYGGDGNASTQTLQSLSDAAPLYLNWLQAWADAARPDGGLPHTAPNPYTAGGGPYWCSFPVQAAWRTYWNYGDTRPLERFYPVMVRWLDYVDAYSVDGLLKPWPNESYRGWYLGDWAAPAGVDVQDPASVDLVANCTLCQVYPELEEMARVLGNEAHAVNYHKKYDALRKRIHETFWHEGIYASGSQLDMVFPLLTGVVPEDLRDQVISTLKARTRDQYKGHLATGLVGIPIITEWATREGECDWLYGILKQRSYPGYLYMIDHGATGVWEEWDGGRSHLHNCYNGIGSWFFQALGGIIPLEPGYRRVRIDPKIPEGLDWVKVTQSTPYGPITVERHGTDVQISLPVGITLETH